ncbi:MAG: M1 family metallopeptidase [candidate division KSB1 bacterium]|nr:M1 family metallopeptidase [candidate division KSB1 bacterium]
MFFKQVIIFFITGLILALAAVSSAQPTLFQKPLSPRIANYDIQVSLDTKQRLLVGQEKLTWINLSPDRVTELQFHLYLNAFRNNRSTFMIESGGSHRGYKMQDDGWGYIEIDDITLPSGERLTEQMEFIHPDNDDVDDKTVFRLPLRQPVLPGKSISLNIHFTAKLPEPPVARSGAKKEYVFAGQWFPKIGVYQNGGWNCHQYHRNSEFFADFGVYNVRITVPKENIVGATGIEVERQDNGDGTATHVYHAEDVHDFAWTTSPEFIVVTDTVQDVAVRVLLQPDHWNQAQRHLDAAKVAIEYFQNWYGDYPYPNLTIVDPRRGAGATGGMEYPTLITAGTAYGLPRGIRMVEMVIIHEFGHNYWYHLVANNEFEEAWLDEGINSYSENQIVADRYGPTGDMFDFWGLRINDLQLQRAAYLFAPDLDPILQKSWNYYSFNSYGVNSYQKPSLVLTTLQNYLGPETMQRIMRTYFERWKFKHPTTQDFIAVANDVSGQDLGWFFDQALSTTAVLDYSVTDVFTREIKKAVGYDFTLSLSDSEDIGAKFQDSTLAPALHDSAAVSIKEDSAIASSDSAGSDSAGVAPLYLSQVTVRRLGAFRFPVEILVQFENGDTVREHWSGQELWKKFRYLKPTRLVSASVDPDRKIPLDINFTNNSRTAASRSKGINKLALRFLFWVQMLLDQPELLHFVTGLSLRM